MLFTDMDLFGAEQGDLFDVAVEPAAPVAPVATLAMPVPFALIQVEDITGQGVLGA